MLYGSCCMSHLHYKIWRLYVKILWWVFSQLLETLSLCYDDNHVIHFLLGRFWFEGVLTHHHSGICYTMNVDKTLKIYFVPF